MEQICEIIVDIAHANVDRLYSYLVPDGMPVAPGSHVLVPFGSGNRQREGFVIRVLDFAESAVQSGQPENAPVLKRILRVIEPYPILTAEQIELAFWIQKSYYCLLVDALRLMIPAQLRGGRVKEKIERTLRLANPEAAQSQLQALLDKSGKPRAPKQYEVLETLINCGLEMSVNDVLAFVPDAQGAIHALIKKGYLVEGGHVTFRRPNISALAEDKHVTLNAAQQSAVEAITAAMEQRAGTLLLHGVTGSGKTEVYMHAIDRWPAGDYARTGNIAHPPDRRPVSGTVPGRNRRSSQPSFGRRAV